MKKERHPLTLLIAAMLRCFDPTPTVEILTDRKIRIILQSGPRLIFQFSVKREASQ